MKRIVLFIRQLFCRHHYRYTEINHDGINTVECKRCGKRKIVKVLHLLTLAFVMYGCCRTSDDARNHSNVYDVFEYDSCEYVGRHGYLSINFAHKGNCKYCAERHKKEQEELIKALTK